MNNKNAKNSNEPTSAEEAIVIDDSENENNDTWQCWAVEDGIIVIDDSDS